MLRFFGLFARMVLGSLLTWPTAAAAEDVVFQVEITADALHVRSKPDTASEIMGTLEKGEAVIAVPSGRDGWLMVLSNENTVGFVSSGYVQLVDIVSLGDSEEDVCEADSARLALDTSLSSFDCQDAIFDDGLQSCETTIDVSVTSICQKSMEARVDCTVEIGYKTQDGFMEHKSHDSGSSTVFLSYGSGHSTIDIDWRPTGFFLDPIVQARVNDASCQVMSVYDW